MYVSVGCLHINLTSLSLLVAYWAVMRRPTSIPRRSRRLSMLFAMVVAPPAELYVHSSWRSHLAVIVVDGEHKDSAFQVRRRIEWHRWWRRLLARSSSLTRSAVDSTFDRISCRLSSIDQSSFRGSSEEIIFSWTSWHWSKWYSSCLHLHVHNVHRQCSSFTVLFCVVRIVESFYFSSSAVATNICSVTRSLKLSSVEPGYYLDGWPPGKTKCCEPVPVRRCGP